MHTILLTILAVYMDYKPYLCIILLLILVLCIGFWFWFLEQHFIGRFSTLQEQHESIILDNRDPQNLFLTWSVSIKHLGRHQDCKKCQRERERPESAEHQHQQLHRSGHGKPWELIIDQQTCSLTLLLNLLCDQWPRQRETRVLA